MTIFRGDYQPDITIGLMNIQSIKQMLFCIAQEESAAQELDAYTLLGVSNILDDAGYEVEASYNRLNDELEAAEKRHMKLRADLAAYMESTPMLEKSAIAKILNEDTDTCILCDDTGFLPGGDHCPECNGLTFQDHKKEATDAN